TGGEEFEAQCISSVEIYNPSTGMWTITDDLNNERMFHTASVLNDGRVLVSGGIDQYTLNTTEIYNLSF
ncbi:unnamed protein product, partial [Adineta steineri]